MNQKTIKIILIGLILYFLSAGLSFALFSAGPLASPKYIPPPTTKNEDGTLSFNQSLPKTETCPLSGALYSKQQRDWWEKHRPLGIMIENHEEARPQSGLASADVIYEAVAEGGITRFLAIFYCQDANIIGPVRSARTYFMDFVSEYGDYPLYVHVGGANTDGPADALSQIEGYGWQAYNDLNQFSIGFPTFWRDYERLGHEVATEHTMYTTSEKLWNYSSSKRKLSNVDEDGNAWDEEFVPYKFRDDSPISERPESQTINFDFWDGYSAYSVNWKYDKNSNSYLRFHGDNSLTDKNNGKQLSSKNVIVLFMTERHANDGYESNAHLLYGTKGTGKATVFINGEEISGTWSKKDRTSRLIIKDKNGKEITYNRGLLWFEILPVGNVVTVN